MLMIIVVLFITQVVAKVIVQESTQYIYDSSLELEVYCSGFDVEEGDITLDLHANGQPLVTGRDFLVTKPPGGDGLVLKLFEDHRWANLSSLVPPVPLILSSVRLKGNDANLIAEPVMIARLLNTPTVYESLQTIYQSDTEVLRIRGSGFIGAPVVEFDFLPYLTKNYVYYDRTEYPAKTDEVVLHLGYDGQTWLKEVGPLRIISVSTGAGRICIQECKGVIVGNVVKDQIYEVTVDSSVDQQLVYADDPMLMIRGSGLTAVKRFIFANPLQGWGTNYSPREWSDSSVSLELTVKCPVRIMCEEGSLWRKDLVNLPAPLTLLAVSNQRDHSEMVELNSGKGVDIAMVFERPNVSANHQTILRTQSKILRIQGTGFPAKSSSYKPMLKFSPALVEGVDYTVSVRSRTSLQLSLLEGRAWSPLTPTCLRVIAINTRGDEGGWVEFSGEGVDVAQVMSDEREGGGDVEIIATGMKVYQSVLKQEIVIRGRGLKEGMSFRLDPVLKEGVDYEKYWMSENEVSLKLKEGKKWRATAGLIVVKSIRLEEKEYSFCESIVVAEVLADPVIELRTDLYKLYESQSKLLRLLPVSGSTNKNDLKLIIRPTPIDSYEIFAVSIFRSSDYLVSLRLLPGKSWLPSSISLNGTSSNKKVLLEVISIDTGAGMVKFDEPLEVAWVVKDVEGFICDDSCEYAFNGNCNYHRNECARGTDCTDCHDINAYIYHQKKSRG